MVSWYACERASRDPTSQGRWPPGPANKIAIQREIDAIDRQIDQLVYELYGLTDDEIRMVEEATQ